MHACIHSQMFTDLALCAQAQSQVLGTKQNMYGLFIGLTVRSGEIAQSAVAVGYVKGCDAGVCGRVYRWETEWACTCVVDR